jgi:hypothetical protein
MVWNPSIIIPSPWDNANGTIENVLNPQVSLTINDFLGECNETQVNNVEPYAIAECVGNALNPSIPNPLKILEPVTGSALDAKLKYLNFFPIDNNGNYDLSRLDPLNSDSVYNKLIRSIWTFPVIILNTFLEVLFNTIKFLLVFVVRFIFTYMFWVSLGFQAVLNYVSSDSKLEHEQKIQYTIALMILGSIFTLGYGGAWITWF